MKASLPGMKLNYFPETDSLYIDHASKKLDLRELVTSHIPLEAKV